VPVRDQIRYWGIAAAVFLLVLWLLGSVILPFLVGGAVAYFLDPLARRLERLGLSRVLAAVVISLGAVMIFILAALLVVPLLAGQLVQLVNSAPDLMRQLQDFVHARIPSLLDEDSTVRQTLGAVGETVQAKGGELANSLLTSALGVINAVIFIVVVPVVAFYLLLDWDKLIERIDALLPREHAPVIRRLACEVDQVLAGFVRGQLLVCLILGSFYAVMLALVGLQFGAVVGVIAGLISFIPYVGTLVGGAMAIGLALLQFWGDWVWIGAVVAIFVIGQMVEGNYLTPKLVGGSVGLHPVWLLFALSAFGTLFGFVGMMVAVPVAAVIGVIARFMAGKYQQSALYGGSVDSEGRLLRVGDDGGAGSAPGEGDN